MLAELWVTLVLVFMRGNANDDVTQTGSGFASFNHQLSSVNMPGRELYTSKLSAVLLFVKM